MTNVILLVLFSLISTSTALQPKYDKAEEEMKAVVSKYINSVPDIESRYVLDEGLSKAIGQYFNGKIQTFPLYKISLKLDRNPVKIPWTMKEPDKEDGGSKKVIYRYVTRKRSSPKIKIKTL